MENYNKQNNIVLIRDGNINISYLKNNFRFINRRRYLKKNARLLIKKTSNYINANKNIRFFENNFENVIIDNQDSTQLIMDRNNLFKLAK